MNKVVRREGLKIFFTVLFLVLSEVEVQHQILDALLLLAFLLLLADVADSKSRV